MTNAPTPRETADHAELAGNWKLRQLSEWKTYVENKEKQKPAHQKVRYAVEKGRLIVPEVCSECGKHAGYAKDGRRLLQAHHDDYDRPLDVRWLCIPCHRAITPTNPHRGSSAVTAEIMEEDAIYIRTSCRSHIELAEMFGVDHSAIRQVRRSATWAHVPTYENLLSEIAALRGERDGLRRLRDDLRDTTNSYQARYRQADRQRDELRRELEFIKGVVTPDQGSSMTDIDRVIFARISRVLANQVSDQ